MSGLSPSILLWAGAGVGLGLLHFVGLWWSTRRIAAGAGALGTVAVTLLRLVLLAAVLVLAVRQGALPLLALTAGLLGGRALVLRRARRPA